MPHVLHRGHGVCWKAREVLHVGRRKGRKPRYHDEAKRRCSRVLDMWWWAAQERGTVCSGVVVGASNTKHRKTKSGTFRTIHSYAWITLIRRFHGLVLRSGGEHPDPHHFDPRMCLCACTCNCVVWLTASHHHLLLHPNLSHPFLASGFRRLRTHVRCCPGVLLLQANTTYVVVLDHVEHDVLGSSYEFEPDGNRVSPGQRSGRPRVVLGVVLVWGV